MKLKRKQVKAIMDLIKKETRHKCLYVINNTLHATNSHAIISIELDEQVQDGSYSFKELQQWYDESSTKDFYTEENITDRINDCTINFDRYTNYETESITHIAIGSKLFNQLTKVFTTVAIDMTFSGRFSPITLTTGAAEDEKIKVILLPYRTNKNS